MHVVQDNKNCGGQYVYPYATNAEVFNTLTFSSVRPNSSPAADEVVIYQIRNHS